MPSSLPPQQPQRPVLFLFGSQTGNAESIARGLVDEAKGRGYATQCAALDDFEKVGFPPKDLTVLIVVCSSTGDGDPPDNAMKFNRFLRRKTNPKDLLAQVKYAALCLGDTNYENFCGGGKKITQGIKDLGATEFYPRGLADDGTNLEQVVDPWITGLWPALEKITGSLISQTGSEVPTTIPESSPAAQLEVSVTLNSVSSKVDETKWRPLVHELKLPKAPEAEPEPSSLPRPPSLSLKVTVGEPVAIAEGHEFRRNWASSFLEATLANPVRGFITRAKCLTTPDAVKRTLALDVKLPVKEEDTNTPYKPGDALGVICPNEEKLVDALLARLRLDGSASVTIELLKPQENENIPMHLRHIKTVKELFLNSFDLHSLPKKTFFRALAPYASDPSERNLILYLCSRQGATSYSDLRLQAPDLLDLLGAFPSCQPPLSLLCDQLTPIMPRYYSIASSALARPDRSAAVAFNIVKYTDATGRERQGLCTNWLDQEINKTTGSVLSREKGIIDLTGEGFALPIFLRRATDFCLPPEDAPVPLLMIGPGTGVSPFIGFLEEWRERRKSRELPETWLFYGCRDASKDFLFKEALESFVDDGTLSKLFVSCSRQDIVSEKNWYKGYVQVALLAQKQQLAELLVKSQARIYVCGDAASMAKDIQNTLEAVLTQGAGIGEGPARLMLQQWRESKRYVVDVWS